MSLIAQLLPLDFAKCSYDGEFIGSSYGLTLAGCFLSTLWYLHKVQRIKRVNVLDLFKEEQLPVEVQNDLSVMYLVQTVISLRLLQGRKMNSLINPEC